MPGDLDVTGLDIADEVLTELFAVDRASWLAEADLTGEYFAQFGDQVPTELLTELDNLRARLVAPSA